jgi:PAS domain S-box-containing protein
VFRNVATRSLDPAWDAFLRARTFAAGRETLIGRVALTGEVVHIPDLTTDPDYRLPETGTLGKLRTMLGVPLLRDGLVVGTLALNRERVAPFTERQIELMRTFADQAVIAIENTRLITETREALEQQTATAEVLQVINSSPGELQPVFEAMLEKAMRLCEAAFGLMRTYDGQTVRMVASQGLPPRFAEFAANPANQPGADREGGAMPHFLAGAHFVHIPDLKEDDAYRSGDSYRVALVEIGGARTMLVVPLRKDGAFLGQIAIYRQEVRPYSDKQIALLQNFAAQAVIAMENARLLGELQARTRDLEESLEYQTATSDVLKVISRSTADVQPVLDTVVETAARLCGADSAAITIREGEVYRYVSSSFSAAEPEYWAALRQRTMVPGRETLPGRVALEGRVVHVADILADPDFVVPEAVKAGRRTILGVPLLRDSEPIGVITLNRQRVEPFTERQIELVRTFADQAVIAMENARLLGELQARTRDLEESLEYQTATSDVLNVISRSTADVQPVLDTVAETAARLCGADQGTILIREGEVYRYMASSFSAAEPEYWAILRQRTIVPGRDSIPARVALEGRVAHVEDLAADPDYALPEVVASGRRTGLGVPLLRDSEPIGIIMLSRNRVEPFTGRQIELVRTFADQAVIAMENARLFGELQARTRDLEESLEYQTATSDVLNVISRSTADVQRVLDTVVETAARLCSADSSTVLIREGDVYRYVASSFSPAEPEFWAILRQRTIVPGRDTVAARVALEGRVVHVEDIRDIPDYAHPEAVASGIRTNLGAPLLREGEPIGIIMLSRKRVERYTERQIELVRTFADQAVIAMENARLLGELQARTRDLEESLEYQTATSDVLNVISRSTADVQPVLDTVAETAVRLCGADTAGIAIREGEVYRLVSSSFSAAEPELWAFARQRTLVPGRSSMTGRVALEGRVVHITDIRADPDFALPETLASGRRTMLGVPLLREGAVLGVISLARKRVEPYNERQIELVRTFADQAVIAMENARLLSELQARTRDLEESLEYQTATSDVLNVISRSTADVQPVLDTAIETAARLCGADTATISIREGEVYRFVSASALDAEHWAILRQRTIVPGRETLAGRVALEGKVVHIADIAADPDFAVPETVAAGIRTGLGVPLLREGAVLGAINLGRNRVQPFAERQIELVRTFADQAVIAIENARLLSELRESLEQQTATAEVLQVINSSPGELQPVFNAILEKAHTHCGATRGTLHLFDGETFRPVAMRGYPQDFAEQVRRGFSIRQASYWEPLLAGAPFVHIADMRLIDAPVARRSAERAGGTRTSLALALRKDGALLGLIACNRGEVRPFSAKEIAFLQNFAAQAVIAMDNARLLEEIRRRQAELRVTFDNMGDGVAMFDAEQRLAAWNRNFQQLLDLPDTLLAARPSLGDYIRHLATRGEYGQVDVEAEVRRLIEAASTQYSTERTRPDGSVIEVRANPVPGGGVVIIYSDITERKRAETEIRTARDTAERALRELQTAQASLLHAQKMAALGQLTAGIAHEIKNPLNFVNNFAGLSVELLDELKTAAAPGIATLDGDTRTEIDETVGMLTGNLEKIAEHGKRADGIVTSMLAHSRGSSGDRRPTDINALVEEALNLAYHGARAQDQSFNVTLERDFDRSLAPIELVPQDLTRVFLNLFGNGFYAAAKRSREAGDGFRPVIQVKTRDLGGDIEIRVRDNGTGIPPESRDKLFQPFFTTKPTGEGTGLGLSISYDIVTQQHGGTIEVDSMFGEFTEFTIRLPRSRQAATTGMT